MSEATRLHAYTAIRMYVIMCVLLCFILRDLPDHIRDTQLSPPTRTPPNETYSHSNQYQNIKKESISASNWGIANCQTTVCLCPRGRPLISPGLPASVPEADPSFPQASAGRDARHCPGRGRLAEDRAPHEGRVKVRQREGLDEHLVHAALGEQLDVGGCDPCSPSDGWRGWPWDRP